MTEADLSPELGTRLARALAYDPEEPLSDFRNLLALVWKHLNLPPPTPVQYDLARHLQFGPRRSIIEAFRGVGKSWITAAFVCWLLLRDPNLNILVVSASKQRSDDFSTFCSRLIQEMGVLRHLRPKPGQRFSKLAFDVGPAGAAHAPSVKSMGITGQLTGSRGDVIIADDVEVPSNSMTQGLRDRLSEAVKEFDSILKPGGAVIFLGTPQLDMSLYNLLPGRGYSLVAWPARYPRPEIAQRLGDRLAESIREALADDPGLATACDGRGAPVDPERFSDDDLREREASYGRSGFALQFMLDTTLSDSERFPLKVSDMIVHEIDLRHGPETIVWSTNPKYRLPELPNAAMDGDSFHSPAALQGDYIPYQGKVMVIDPSGRGSDETAYAVAYFLNGNIFIPEAGGVAGGYSESTLTALARIAKKHAVNAIVVESNFGDGMFSELLKPYLRRIYPVTVEPLNNTQQKEVRIIDTLEPVMNQHRLIVDPSVIQRDFESVQSLPAEKQAQYMLVYQLTRVTKERGALRHDDRLDALAMAVGYWGDRMGLDQEESTRKRHEERYERMMKLEEEAATTGGSVHSVSFSSDHSAEDDAWI
jgi:hypothetical protein